MGKIEFPPNGIIAEIDKKMSPFSLYKVREINRRGKIRNRRRITFGGVNLKEVLAGVDPKKTLGISFRSGGQRVREHVWLNADFEPGRNNQAEVSRPGQEAVVVDLRPGINSTHFTTKRNLRAA